MWFHSNLAIYVDENLAVHCRQYKLPSINELAGPTHINVDIEYELIWGHMYDYIEVYTLMVLTKPKKEQPQISLLQQNKPIDGKDFNIEILK